MLKLVYGQTCNKFEYMKKQIKNNYIKFVKMSKWELEKRKN